MVRARGTLRVQEIPIAFCDRGRGKSKISFGIALRFLFSWLRALRQHLLRNVKNATSATTTDAERLGK
jgi:hypothetical protein